MGEVHNSVISEAANQRLEKQVFINHLNLYDLKTIHKPI